MPQNSVATMTRPTVFVLVQTISSSLAQPRDLKSIAKIKSFFEIIIEKNFSFRITQEFCFLNSEKGCVPSDDAPKISEGACRKRRQAINLGGPNLGGVGANPFARVFIIIL